jgi:hypothetical protein
MMDTTHLCIVLMLRTSGDMHVLQYMRSWRGQGQVYLYLYLYISGWEYG